MSHEPYLSLGKFRYDPAHKLLTDANRQEVKLRPQSLAVLDLLVTKPNEVVTKDEIFQTVWKDVSVTDDSLVQCIADIRRVLGDKKHKILKTLPRRGYTLVIEKANKSPLPRYQFFQSPMLVGGGLVFLLVGMLAVLMLLQTNDPVEDRSQAPTLALTVSSGTDLTEQERQVADKTRIALSRYRTIRLTDRDNTDFSLILKPQAVNQKEQQSFDLELLDGKSGTVFFGESFQLASDETAVEKMAARIAATVASPGGGAIGKRLLALSKNKPVAELSDYECFAHGYGCPTCSGEEETITPRAKACLANILQREPRNAKAWALQSTIITRQNWFGVALDEEQKNDPDLTEKLQKQAMKAAVQAEALSEGENDSAIYWGLAQAYVTTCELDKLKAAVDRGLAINPNDPNLLASFGNWLVYAGFREEGFAMVSKALELEPLNYKKWWWYGIAKYHYHHGNYEKTLAAFMKSYNERNWLSHLQLAYTYPYLNRVEDAREEAKKVQQLFPGFTRDFAVGFYEKFCFQKSYLKKMEQGLKKAGLN